MSQNSNTDAEDILSELENTKEEISTPESEIVEKSETVEKSKIEEQPKTENVHKQKQNISQLEVRNTIPIGKKPIMTYVNSTLTQLSSLPLVTITARGKSITTAVDVSQFILKRMDHVGYKINDVRISSNLLESNDGKKRNVSSIEIDIMRTDT